MHSNGQTHSEMLIDVIGKLNIYILIDIICTYFWKDLFSCMTHFSIVIP